MQDCGFMEFSHLWPILGIRGGSNLEVSACFVVGKSCREA